METVEEGVANFKLFQTDMREFVTEFKTNERNKEKTDARRSRIHYGLLTLLCGLIIAMFTFILNHYDGKKISFDIHDQSRSMPKENADTHTLSGVSSVQHSEIPPLTR